MDKTWKNQSIFAIFFLLGRSINRAFWRSIDFFSSSTNGFIIDNLNTAILIVDKILYFYVSFSIFTSNHVFFIGFGIYWRSLSNFAPGREI